MKKFIASWNPRRKRRRKVRVSVHRVGLMLLCGHTPTIYRVNGQGTRKEGRKEQGYAIHLVIFAHRALRTKQTYKRKGMENEFYNIQFFWRAHRTKGVLPVVYSRGLDKQNIRHLLSERTRQKSSMPTIIITLTVKLLPLTSLMTTKANNKWV